MFSMKLKFSTSPEKSSENINSFVRIPTVGPEMWQRLPGKSYKVGFTKSFCNLVLVVFPNVCQVFNIVYI